MFIKVPHLPGKRKLLKLIAASVACTTFFPINSVSAEDIDDSNDDNKNVTVKNYLEGEDFIFTAERIPTNRWDTPANVYVITAEDIEENHYQTIEEALNHVNGVVTVMIGSKSSVAAMNGDSRVLLLIDGRRANNSQTDHNPLYKSDLMMFPSMKNIERIEIVKGGYSALYGTDAVGGVINIITKKGTRNETTLDLNYGSWSKQNYELTNQGEVGKFSWFLTGALAQSDAYHYKGPGTDALSDVSDYNDKSFSIRMDNRFTDRDSLTFGATYKTHKWFDKHFGGRYNNISLSYNFKEGTTTPGWLRYFNNNKTIWLPERTNMRMQGVEYQNGWEFGRHKIILGAEWHKNEASDPENGYKDKDVNNGGFYIQDTIRLGDKWNVIPGTRYDHSSKYGNNWSPKLSANYRADDKTKIYASWGRVYRTPTLAELYIVDELNDYYGNEYVLANGGENKLRSEKGHTETIGIEHNFTDDIGIAVNFFHSKMNDAIFWEKIMTPYYNSAGKITKYGVTHIPTNKEISKKYGVEISFSHKIDEHFSYNLGYSHTKIKNVLESSYWIQPNGYRVGVHYQNRGLHLNLLSFMASGRTEGESDWIGYPSSKYAVFDFNALYDINEFSTVYFKANNFTNQNYSPTSKDYHVPGKFFMVGATFRF